MADRGTKPKKQSAEAKQASPIEALTTVGIGVCAASLDSLLALFSGLTNGLLPSYVVGVRQQDGLTVETVVEALSKSIKLPVKKAQDGENLEPGVVHVGGGAELITISDGHVVIRPATQAGGNRGTVDTLLISLAEHARDRAVAVILAGLGSDGTAGVSATKQFGGLSIAESLNGEDDAAEQG
ncbi:MAG: chemotaxis protein CheB, partial [Sphingomonas sp.]